MLFSKKVKPYIKFHTKEDVLNIIPHPVPAAKAMPDWFKKLKPQVDNSTTEQAGAVKRCMPVLDAVSQGYIIPLWADLHVRLAKKVQLYGKGTPEGGEKEELLITEIDYLGDPEELVGKTIDDIEGNPLVVRAERGGETFLFIKFPEVDLGVGQLLGRHGWQQVGNSCDLKKFKFGKQLLKFTNPWIIETAPGWSVKFQNPANNWSNDIQLIEGVVDTDEYYSEVNFPYVWTGSELGEFLIPRGTPLVHVIPFERAAVKLEVGVHEEAKKQTVIKKMYTKHYNRYKTFFWSKRKK